MTLCALHSVTKAFHRCLPSLSDLPPEHQTLQSSFIIPARGRPKPWSGGSTFHHPDLLSPMDKGACLNNVFGVKKDPKRARAQMHYLCLARASLIVQMGKESTCNSGDPGLIPGLGRSAGEGIGYSLQYSCVPLVAQLAKNLPAIQEGGLIPGVGKIPLEKATATNPRILAWSIPWGIAHGVAKSRTPLSHFHYVRMLCKSPSHFQQLSTLLP